MKRYTLQEKQMIVERHTKLGEPVQSILKSNNLAKSTFYNWLKIYHNQELNNNKPIISVRTYKLLEAKVQRLTDMVNILQSIPISIKASLQDKLHVAETLSKSYSVHVICDALQISRGTYYNHVLRNKRSNTWYAKRRETLRIRIQELYDETNQIFGAEKITALLKNEGYKTCKKLVAELMKDMGLTSIRQGAKKLYDDEYRRHKNYVNQQFDVAAPNQVWVSDVTYFKCKDKSYYICVILDLYARKAISYHISQRNSTQLIKQALKKACTTRSISNNLILHTDRGGNFCSKTFNDCVNSFGITHSFSRAYVPYDNSVIESFFSSLKREELYRRKYSSEKELLNSIAFYVNFYNSRRPHAKIQYKTPDQKEKEYIDDNYIFST